MKRLFFIALFFANLALASQPTVAIVAGKLCLVAPGTASTCLFKDEWQDRLKALQEYIREHDQELKPRSPQAVDLHSCPAYGGRPDLEE